MKDRIFFKILLFVGIPFLSFGVASYVFDRFIEGGQTPVYELIKQFLPGCIGFTIISGSLNLYWWNRKRNKGK